jgi:hypothetical protein
MIIYLGLGCTRSSIMYLDRNYELLCLEALHTVDALPKRWYSKVQNCHLLYFDVTWSDIEINDIADVIGK